MREKGSERKIISVNLDIKEIELMNFDKNKEGFSSVSAYVGWLIRSRNELTNPAQYLKNIDRKEQELDEEYKKLKEKRREAVRNMELTKEIDIIKNKKRPEAIKIIQRKYLEEGVLVAEQYAKNWGMVLNCSATELLFEAIRSSQKENEG